MGNSETRQKFESALALKQSGASVRDIFTMCNANGTCPKFSEKLTTYLSIGMPYYFYPQYTNLLYYIQRAHIFLNRTRKYVTLKDPLNGDRIVINRYTGVVTIYHQDGTTDSFQDDKFIVGYYNVSGRYYYYKNNNNK